MTDPSSPPAAAGAGIDERIAADAAFLGLEGDAGNGEFRFVVEDRLARMDGRLYGGTAIAVSIAAAEQVTRRSALWMTTQFVSTAAQEATISVRAEILAAAKRTSQVRITGTDDQGTVAFASLGATGHHRAGGISGHFENCPEVGPPFEGDAWASPFSGMAEAAGIELAAPPVPRDTGFNRMIELRPAEIHAHPDPGPGRICLWVRRRDREPITPAMAAFVADMVPMAVARAAGVLAFGTSLDNTIRIGSFVQTEWVLLDLRPHLAHGDYGHGAAHVWSQDGHLMATASQTASMRAFDPNNLPWASGPKS